MSYHEVLSEVVEVPNIVSIHLVSSTQGLDQKLFKTKAKQ